VTSVIIDRRQNPRDRSLVNRQRFIERVRDGVRKSSHRALGGKGLHDRSDAELTVAGGGVAEPRFAQDPRTGERDIVLPGNRQYSVGDLIEKPQSGGGGAGGTQPGQGEGDFSFGVSHDELVDIIMEDLELPRLLRRSHASVETTAPRRAGYAPSGPPSSLDVGQTMAQSLARRIALRGPKLTRLAELEREREQCEDEERRTTIEAEIARLSAMAHAIAFLDPLDLRYRRFERQPKPSARAVMLCIIDVSASMGDRERRLAKQFFHLLSLFLHRKYREVDIVFVRHHHEAEECDEATFFASGSTGSTVVSTAYRVAEKVIKERFSSEDWNLYLAQVSDGDNMGSDGPACAEALGRLLPRARHLAYVEVLREGPAHVTRTTDLWSVLEKVARRHDNLGMRQVMDDDDVVPAFRSLFAGLPAGVENRA
jgi:uncharacterized sporulation protein YeaH/YhbH (DUF444 family)